MKAPEGMKWIDVTYTARRAEDGDEGILSSISEGEACMQILVSKEVAGWLSDESNWAGSFADGYILALERILRDREWLCFGQYVEGSIKDIRIMEDDDE